MNFELLCKKHTNTHTCRKSNDNLKSGVFLIYSYYPFERQDILNVIRWIPAINCNIKKYPLGLQFRSYCNKILPD